MFISQFRSQVLVDFLLLSGLNELLISPSCHSFYLPLHVSPLHYPYATDQDIYLEGVMKWVVWGFSAWLADTMCGWCFWEGQAAVWLSEYRVTGFSNMSPNSCKRWICPVIDIWCVISCITQVFISFAFHLAQPQMCVLKQATRTESELIRAQVKSSQIYREVVFAATRWVDSTHKCTHTNTHSPAHSDRGSAWQVLNKANSLSYRQ